MRLFKRGNVGRLAVPLLNGWECRLLFFDLVKLVESNDFIFVIGEAVGARLGYKFLVFFGGLESLESLEEVVPAFFFLV